ncbi:MAG TPA: galactose oxidase, partial [Candidatus Kapabacteria bacterium]|nr:galactose oxidase [Candidatus Kapabacteria bacterium]
QVDVFDPSTNAWTTPKATGTFSDRSGLGAAVINGKIYTVGGGNNYVKDEQQETYFEVFQP